MRSALALPFAAFVAVSPVGVSAQDVADTIYRGGPILTIDDAAPRVEAVAVKDGRIIAAGAGADVMALEGEGTAIFELDGLTMLPGFVDSHGHVLMGGMQALASNLLAPPDGEVTDIAGLQETLRNGRGLRGDSDHHRAPVRAFRRGQLEGAGGGRHHRRHARSGGRDHPPRFRRRA